jgi:hypothetical protein
VDACLHSGKNAQPEKIKTAIVALLMGAEMTAQDRGQQFPFFLESEAYV